MRKVIKVKKIEFYSDQMIIACPPLSHFKEPPKEQKDCVVEECPACNEKMWVSIKKRNLRKKDKNVDIYCIFCIVTNCKDQEFEPEIIDLNKLN